jgi:hypothetical protein
LHGYDYRRIILPETEMGIKARLQAIQALLPSYQIMILVTNDACLESPQLPIEYLLNRWNFKPDTSLAVSLGSLEGKHIIKSECLLVAQNIPQTYDLLRVWSAKKHCEYISPVHSFAPA